MLLSTVREACDTIAQDLVAHFLRAGNGQFLGSESIHVAFTDHLEIKEGHQYGLASVMLDAVAMTIQGIKTKDMEEHKKEVADVIASKFALILAVNAANWKERTVAT